MKKGLGVIIARKTKNGLETDSICNCDAAAFSKSQPVILQTTDFSKVADTQPLYLCGHGSRMRHKISDFSMKEIAKMFKDHGYTGKQKIYIASCYGLRKHFGKTAAEKLQSEFKKLGIECSCHALARDISFIYVDNSSEVFCASVKMSKFCSNVCFLFQKLKFDSFAIDRSKKDKTSNFDHVMNWNSDIIQGHYNGLFMLNAELYPLIIGMLISCLLILYRVPLTFDVLPLAVLWLIAEFTTLRGFAISIIIWIPLMVTLSSHMWIFGLRLLISLILAGIADYKYVQQYVAK